MPFQLDVFDKRAYRYIVATGSVESIEELLQYGADILSIAETSDANCILLDERERRENLQPADIAEFATLTLEQNIQNISLRVAVLMRELTPLIEYFDLILQNRTVANYKMFSDVAAAESWLMNNCSPREEEG